MRRFTARLSAVLASVLALAAGLASPARAADTGSLNLQFSPTTLSVAPSPGKSMGLAIFAHNAQHPVLTVDRSGLGDKATLKVLVGTCAGATGPQIVCPLDDLPLDPGSVTLVFQPTSTAVAGDVLHLTLTLSADNAPSAGGTAEIKVADAIDLVASPQLQGKELPAKIGDHVTIAASVRNLGSRTAKGIRLTWTADHGLLPDGNDGCTTVPVEIIHELVCEWPDVTLAPGQSLAVKDKLGHDLVLAVAADASKFEATDFTFTALSEVPAGATPPNDADEDDNLSEAEYTIDGEHHDASAIGASATGAVGQSVDVNIGFTDNGPAALNILRSGGEPALIFYFTRPANAEIVGIPETCDSATFNDGQMATEHKPGGDYYRCKSASFIPVGAPQTVKFTLKIVALHGAAGTVNFTNKFDPPDATPIKDDNPANDQADVVINPETPVSTGTTGVTPISLPVTGAPLALIAIVGVAIVAGGVVLLRLGRRRGRA